MASLITPNPIPDSTAIYYSTPHAVQMAISIPINVIALTVFLWVPSFWSKSIHVPYTILGSVFIVLSIISLVRNVRKARSNAPQVVISNEGIYVAESGQHSWASIAGEQVIKKRRMPYLIFQSDATTIKVNAATLQTDAKELAGLLTRYRAQYAASLY